MQESITLRGRTDYHEDYPPKGAKKGYVARITGRAAGAVKYEREFLGSEVTVLPGDEGLYEVQRGDKKGGCTRWYYVVLSHPEHGLIWSTDCEDDLPKIAKLLDDGVSIEDAVEACDIETDTRDRVRFTARARTKAQAKKAKAAATTDEAADRCYEVLRDLTAAEQKGVLTALRKRAAEGGAA